MPPGNKVLDRATLEKTVALLSGRHSELAEAVRETISAGAADRSHRIPLIEARAVVATLRAMVLDVTFDDTYGPAEVAEISEIYELWRGYVAGSAT